MGKHTRFDIETQQQQLLTQAHSTGTQCSTYTRRICERMYVLLCCAAEQCVVRCVILRVAMRVYESFVVYFGIKLLCCCCCIFFSLVSYRVYSVPAEFSINRTLVSMCLRYIPHSVDIIVASFDI